MKIDIAEQRKNPLMKRDELLVSIEHTGAATPRRREILPHIVKTLKTKDNLVIISKIFSHTGSNTSKAKVFVYGKAEDVPKDMAEKMQRQLKKGKQPEAAAGEKPAEAPKEEAKPEKKAEAPKEEAKAEKAPEAPKAEEKKE
jgi:ribosomal protein S24E